MAALTDAQKLTCFEIFGVPKTGSGYVVHTLVSLFGPEVEQYDFSAVATALQAKLDAVADDLTTKVDALLDQWDSDTSYDPMKIQSSTDTQGTIIDMEQERENIRQALGNLLGFCVPHGGFIAELKRVRHSGPTACSGGGRISR